MQLIGTFRDTARRETIKLADNKLVISTYGDIILAISFNKIDDYLGRTDKKLLVKKASELLLEKQTIYLDALTTVSLLPQYIGSKNRNLAITNSIDIADHCLKTTSIPTTILGGTLNKESRSVTGGYAIWEVTKYRFDISFLSCVGTSNQGIYYAHEEDIETKQAIKEKRNKVVLLYGYT